MNTVRPRLLSNSQADYLHEENGALRRHLRDIIAAWEHEGNAVEGYTLLARRIEAAKEWVE